MRPREIAEERLQAYADELEAFRVESKPIVKSVGRASFDRAIGATD